MIKYKIILLFNPLIINFKKIYLNFNLNFNFITLKFIMILNII